MPSKSPKQRRFMAAAANNPDFARRAGIPQSVASEYHEADKNRMYEGGLAPMNDIIQRGFAPELGGLEQAFAKGGDVPGFAFGGSSWVGNWGSRKRKNLRLLDLMAPWRTDTRNVKKKEKRRRAKALRQQEKGKWGDEVISGVKDPRKRRALVRAGWIAETPHDTRKGQQGAKGRKGKMYDTALNKHTVFYPPREVGLHAGRESGDAIGLTRNIQYRDPASYISTPGGAEGGAVGYQEGGPVGIRTWADIPGKNLIAKFFMMQRMKKEGWVPDQTLGEGTDIKSVTWYPPEQTLTGQGSGVTTPGYDPYYGRRRNGPGGRGGRGGRGGGPRGRRTPPGEPPPPRVIPPGRPPGDDGLVPPPDAPPYTPPDRRAGRDTEYSRALRAHRERVASTLGLSEGGTVRGYAEGGTARADNPYPRGSNRWKVWERKHGRDPNEPDSTYEEQPPAVEEQAEEERGWWARLTGSEEDRQTRTERELEKLKENARGGYVGYQMGGYARAPMGGVPPHIAGAMKPRGGVPMRAMPPTPQGGLQQVTGGPGKPMGMLPVKSTGLQLPPGMGGAPDATTQPVGPPGGPMVPPNLRGYLQRARMMNRPRRGVPGPAGAGGAPNRVGMSDQQGGLARALQRGTGRPPMSRRQGFYR